MALLTIAIPTRNRRDYAVACVRCVLRVPSQDLEVVVQDNSDSDELGRCLQKQFSDERLRYAYEGGRMSVVENCNRALARATGEYVTLLGDDDGVNPEIIDAVRWANKNRVDALIPAPLAHFNWPDVRAKYYGSKWAGTLSVKPFTGSMTCHDVDRALVVSAKSAFQNLVESVNLPKLYYGIVRRACLQQLAETTGTYFNGVSPDMAAAIGLSKYVRITHVVDYPLFVPGTSAKSTAGASVRKEHWGRLRDQPHLPLDVEEHWPAVVPMFFAVQTVWAQSAVTALCATGREALLKDFDVGLLHAMCAVFNPRYARFTVRSYYRLLRATKQGVLSGSMSLLRGFLATWLIRARYLVRRFSGSGQTEYLRSGLADIDEAATALTEYLTRSGRRFATSNPAE